MLSIYNFYTIYSYLSHSDLGKWLCFAKKFPGKNNIEQRILAEKKVISVFYNINNWNIIIFFKIVDFLCD